MFGEGSVLDDGRQVIAPFLKPGLVIGTFPVIGPILRMPDAALDSLGRVWACGKEQNGLGGYVLDPDLHWWRLVTSTGTPYTVYGARMILRADGEGCRVAFTGSNPAVDPASGSRTWICLKITAGPPLQMAVESMGAIPDGSGGNGMRGWDAAGAPLPMSPLDAPLHGRLARAATTVNAVTIASSLDQTLPDQVFMAKGIALGTLNAPGSDWQSLRLSANGQHWFGIRYVGQVVLGGPVPLVVPPLQTFPPTPEPPVTPKATIASYETPILLSGTSRAVAKVTQGQPDRFRWQWNDGGTWQTAADNPVSDLDHHYKFPRTGQFAIRLQTVKAGVITDTSNSTSRVVTVQPETQPQPPEPPNPTQPPTPGPGQVVAHVTDSQTHQPIAGAATWSQLTPTVKVLTDANGYALITALASGVCAKKDGYHSPGLPNLIETCKVISPLIELELEPVPPPAPPVEIFTASSERIFRTTLGAPLRYRGVSQFKLEARYRAGENIDWAFQAFAGFNVFRIFAYAPWDGTGWDVPTADQLKTFCAYCAAKGFNVECTLLTDDVPARLEWAKQFIPQLAAGTRPVNLLLEAGNEPETHKHINTAALKPMLDASGYVYASGNYETNTSAFGKYGNAHTARDSEWPRKAHDLMEYYNGGGPHALSDPARRYPWVGDEPAKTQDVAAPVPPLTKADDWRAYFGTAAILGAGGTFHSENGKFSTPPTDEEKTLAAAALEGLTAFPADAPLWAYTRPTDSTLRTYICGRSMVRIRPTTPDPPLSGWVRTGSSAILWRHA